MSASNQRANRIQTARKRHGGTERQTCNTIRLNGGPGEIRTHDLFHAMEARSQLRHRPIWYLQRI
jgi:hypothetical protein